LPFRPRRWGIDAPEHPVGRPRDLAVGELSVPCKLCDSCEQQSAELVTQLESLAIDPIGHAAVALQARAWKAEAPI